jgi:hypothetical protein
MARPPVGAPWVPPPWEDADVYAVKALAAGNASEGQQKRALDLIINRLCSTYDLSYRPASDRDTVFAEGKRFVGLQLVKMLKIVPKA